MAASNWPRCSSNFTRSVAAGRRTPSSAHSTVSRLLGRPLVRDQLLQRHGVEGHVRQTLAESRGRLLRLVEPVAVQGGQLTQDLEPFPFHLPLLAPDPIEPAFGRPLGLLPDAIQFGLDLDDRATFHLPGGVGGAGRVNRSGGATMIACITLAVTSYAVASDDQSCRCSKCWIAWRQSRSGGSGNAIKAAQWRLAAAWSPCLTARSISARRASRRASVCLPLP